LETADGAFPHPTKFFYLVIPKILTRQAKKKHGRIGLKFLQPILTVPKNFTKPFSTPKYMQWISGDSRWTFSRIKIRAQPSARANGINPALTEW